MAKIYAHFQTLPLRFDGLYSGFLGSWEQLALVEDVFAHYRRADTLLQVDPVMADHGKLYATYTETLARDMGRLCRQADVIVPNLTEAAILLEASYREQPSFPQVEAMLRALHKRYGCRQAVITGILRDGLLGAAAYDAQRDCVFFMGSRRWIMCFTEPETCWPAHCWRGSCAGAACRKPPPWPWTSPIKACCIPWITACRFVMA